MFRTSNPAFSRNAAYAPAQTWDDLSVQGRSAEGPAVAAAPSKIMTMQGTVNKTFLLLAICAAAAIGTWQAVLPAGEPYNGLGLFSPMLGMWGGLITGFILAMVCIFKPNTSPVVAPLYAIAEGAFVGAFSAVYAVMFAKAGDPEAGGVQAMLNTGLIFNAVLLTFGIAGGTLAAYGFKLVRPNRMFYNIVIAGTIGVVLYGLIAIVAGLLGSYSLMSVYDPTDGGLIGIGFALLVVVLAAANLVLDFDMTNNAIRARAPKYMEWYSGFGILMTLVWLYVYVLLLLSKLQSRD